VSRETHKIAVIVFCEAEGVDDMDAAAGAQMALSRLIYQNNQTDKQGEVGQVRGPSCSSCGISWPEGYGPAVDEDGNIKRHVDCERWSPEELKHDQMNDGFDEPLADACEGSGKPPREPSEPVIGFTREDGLPIYMRVHQIMDAGMAAGNGYVWMQPTWKAFR
jgi:hypothetical protein